MKVKLYKYTPHLQSFLENPVLRCTPSHDLNDPFELQPNAETLDSFSKVYSGSYGINDLASFVDVRTSDSGIISLSETKSNLLMWSHYANEHKGGVIEFTFDIKFDNEQKMLQRGFLKSIFDNKYLFDRVKYRLEREPDSELFNSSGFEVFLDLKSHLSFTKAEAWSYEKEYRFLCELHSADVVCVNNSQELINLLTSLGLTFKVSGLNSKLLVITNYNDNSFDLTVDLNHRLRRQQLLSVCRDKSESIFHFYEVDPKCVTGVYLGCKSPSELKHKVLNTSVLDKFDNLNGRVFDSRLSRSRYELSFEKIA
ncbi:DUF2971 domain-containing protein [Vibrio harveyi]|uniref:DUF2971 domain-containing protein n=1 Tax=Vibrio harveyi TaxID=669 RepID=UPI000C7A0205|nr:DUF2971 domain-containing protein [Vibrio harveyi]